MTRGRLPAGSPRGTPSAARPCRSIRRPTKGRHDKWTASRTLRPVPQQPPVAAEHLGQIVGERAHARNVAQVAPDDQPYLAFRQPVGERNRREVRIVGGEVAGKQRDAEAGARGGGLRGLAVGAQRKPPLAELLREPGGFRDVIALVVEANERRRRPASILSR